MYTIVLALHLFCLFFYLLWRYFFRRVKARLSELLSVADRGDVFGPGAPVNIMNRITTIVAILFMVTSLTLAILSTQKSTDSVVDQFQPAAEQTVPAPAEKPAVPAESK